MFTDVQAVHLCGMAAMFFFALAAFVTFFITRDKVYLYNALWLWGGLLGVYAGFYAQPGEVIRPTPVEGFIGFVFYPWFAIYFLRLNADSRLYRFLRFFSTFLIFYLCSSFILKYFLSKEALWTLYQLVSLFGTVSFAWFIFQFLKRKDALSYFFLVGTAGLILLLVVANTLFGMNRPYSGIAGNPYILCTAAGVWDALWFTLGLGYRTYLTQAENKRLNLEKLEQEIALEQERVRTAEKLRLEIAQDIHDEVGADLSKLSLASEFAAMLPDLKESDLREKLRNIGEQVRSVAQQLSDIVFAINPRYDRLAEVQAYFREKGREFLEEAQISSKFDLPAAPDNPAVSPNVKRHLYMLYRESLNNIAKHAKAQSVDIRFGVHGGNAHYVLEIRDNGVGFDPAHTRQFGNGLKGMQSRSEKIGAMLKVESTPGLGASIRVSGPL
jgi:signal transduction histidine kinase